MCCVVYLFVQETLQQKPSVSILAALRNHLRGKCDCCSFRSKNFKNAVPRDVRAFASSYNGYPMGVFGVIYHTRSYLYIHSQGMYFFQVDNLFCIFSPQTKSAKILWLVVVCVGFIGAAILIGKSYQDWQENPIATSITTHPIDDLDFPSVTICPPRDSNTALYHDLVKAGNGTLSDENKKNIEKGRL